ncbi:hypothetical protein EJB05_24694, partial [Eragrostis curvula]
MLLLNNNAGFTGEMPTSVVNLSTTLQGLSFDVTGISGSIPSSISNLVGQIPSSIGNMSKMTNLDAYSSKLQGPIPASIGNLNNLAALDLSMNRLNGSIPREVFKLPAISVYLNLSYNSLSGPLPSEVGSLSNLNKLVLSGNQLSGCIPESIGECTVLQQLWLDDNLLEGNIPQSLNNIKGLSVLNLSMNKLSGVIPDAIGSINNLQQLYLAHNNFSGPIPAVLQNLTSLSELDLSFNNLQGEVPNRGIFAILANLSITGNTQLCGGIAQLHLAPCRVNSVKKNITGKSLTIALATIGAFLFLAFVVALILLVHMKLIRKKNSRFLPPVIEERHERISYHTLANGTNEFSETNLLGKGSFGAVYKCTSQDDGTIFAVKVFNLEQSGSARSFVAECEALRRVRHRSLIKIITCCSSINQQGQEFKALVFEFMPNEDMSARVGDFGISRILPESGINILQSWSRTIGMRGSIGYVAPEYGEGSPISTLGDVYSFGILLLEIFTGRCPTNDMFRGSLDLHKFSENALPDKIWEIADATLWLHTEVYDNNKRQVIEKCLFSVITLGVSCSKRQPKERTPIQDVAIEVRAIRDSFLMLS